MELLIIREVSTIIIACSIISLVVSIDIIALTPFAAIITTTIVFVVDFATTHCRP